MNWYLIIYLVLGGLIGFLPGPITDNIEKAMSLEGVERFNKMRNIRVWLIVLSWVIIFTSVGAAAHLAAYNENKTNELTERVDSLELRIKALEPPTIELPVEEAQLEEI